MHQNPARMARERRQTPATTPVSTPSAVVDGGVPSTVNLAVPTSTTVLAVAVSVLALVVLLGVGICMFRRWKRGTQKIEAPPAHIIDFTSEKTRRYEIESKLDLHASAYGLEKPSPVFMPGASVVDMNPGWVPQINPNRTADLASQPSSSSKKSKSSRNKSLRTSRGWDKTFSKFAPSERSPPPSYMVANDGSRTASVASQIPLPPSPPHQSTLPPTPPTPPAKKQKLNPFSREFPPAKPAATELLPQMPLPSPARSASFANHQSASFERADDDDVPRLMTVVSMFTPTLEDELSIQVGEAVRILEEYQDGWALVQRIGRIDAPKGVVPRTCLTERERVIPTYTPGRRL